MRGRAAGFDAHICAGLMLVKGGPWRLKGECIPQVASLSIVGCERANGWFSSKYTEAVYGAFITAG